MNATRAYLDRYRPDTRPSRATVRSWLFMRLSGLALVFLVLGHMMIMHLLDGGVDRVDFDFVASRWAHLGWRAYDWLLLVLALIHGGLGARIALHDHVKRLGLRRALTLALYLVVCFMLVFGTLILATFDVASIPSA